MKHYMNKRYPVVSLQTFFFFFFFASALSIKIVINSPSKRKLAGKILQLLLCITMFV